MILHTKKSSRRGVSYLVTVVLMTLIAVALSTLLYAYFSGWIGERTSSTGPTGALSVVESYYNSTDQSFILYVRNDGTGDVNITTAYVIASNGTVIDTGTPVNAETNDHNNVVKPGSTIELKVQPDSSLDSGVYQVKLVADDGSQVVTTVRVR
jgi:archaellum component FlaF (FlaF/FlaG flagellin family)